MIGNNNTYSFNSSFAGALYLKIKTYTNWNSNVPILTDIFNGYNVL